jgi:hypothetical protein
MYDVVKRITCNMHKCSRSFRIEVELMIDLYKFYRSGHSHPPDEGRKISGAGILDCSISAGGTEKP